MSRSFSQWRASRIGIPQGWADACAPQPVWCHTGPCSAPELSAAVLPSRTAEQRGPGHSVWTSGSPGSHLLPKNVHAHMKTQIMFDITACHFTSGWKRPHSSLDCLRPAPSLPEYRTGNQLICQRRQVIALTLFQMFSVAVWWGSDIKRLFRFKKISICLSRLFPNINHVTSERFWHCKPHF